MFKSELLRIAMMHPAVGIQQVQLLTHADDGAAGVAVEQRVVQFPVVEQVCQDLVRHVQLEEWKVR